MPETVVVSQCSITEIFIVLEGCELFLDKKIDSRDYDKTMSGQVMPNC